MAKRKSVISRLDRKAREIVRLRDKVCQCPECQHGYNLQCAHVAVIRKYYLARWDLLNLLLMCEQCHQKFDTNKAWGMAWFAEKFPARFKYLTDLKIRSRKVATWRNSDLELIEDGLDEKLKELKNQKARNK